MPCSVGIVAREPTHSLSSCPALEPVAWLLGSKDAFVSNGSHMQF